MPRSSQSRAKVRKNTHRRSKLNSSVSISAGKQEGDFWILLKEDPDQDIFSDKRDRYCGRDWAHIRVERLSHSSRLRLANTPHVNATSRLRIPMTDVRTPQIHPFSQSRYCSDSRVSFVCSFLDELGLAGCRFLWYLVMCYCVVGVRRAGGEWMRLSSEEACTTGMDGPAEIGPRKFIGGNKLAHPRVRVIN
ncbi:hypothetical protein CPB84DRAFT_1751579 [Gymnopilus junonius]|uniref:Uncharacterized protein n=1 Tax=Gymnopilus junonius TaxID=109634 RepID=A0A9P5TGY8_GYMJU|nr:hypothetical protein CPB84DRAFT_1751579 [Gymnopilus junonius]